MAARDRGPAREAGNGAGRLLAAPDSFKGTCSAREVAEAIVGGGSHAGWVGDVCPMSDGGEGFTQVMADHTPEGRGAWRSTTVTGPLGAPVSANWWSAGSQAVLESAAASGLVLAGGAEGNDPVRATSRGTGELVVAAIAAGARRVLVGMGGSASTDGGEGALEAVLDAGGIGDTEVIVACDVEYPFLEAAQRFGPQKGASGDQVVQLRRRLERLAGVYEARFGVDVRRIRYSGAAGGLAGGLAVLGASLVGGFDLVAREVGLHDRITVSGLVVTGEGAVDASSWAGKVVGGVLKASRGAGVGVLVIAGRVADDAAARPPGPATVVETLSLEESFGLARALEEPARCISEIVTRALVARGRSGNAR